MKIKRKVGRPQNFDRMLLLEKAMMLFWEKGYEMTSMSDLVDVLGVSYASIYATFQNKEKLYLESIELYLSGPAKYLDDILETHLTAKETITKWLNEAALKLSSPDHPKGCMVALSAINCPPSIRNAVSCYRAITREKIQKKIVYDIESNIISDVNAYELSDFFVSVLYGMSIHAIDGASVEKLQSIVNISMKIWPE